MALKCVSSRQRQAGFTIVELIMVIIIMGIIGGMVAVFMKSPIDAYFAGGRRAALTDVADTTVRRIARDLQRALPNSIRTNGATCLEFIATKTGGRYRTQDNLAGDSLNFAIADSTFNMLGSNTALPASQQIAQNDLIVVYNLGITGADAYSAQNWTPVSAAPTQPITYTPAETVIPITNFKFPLASGSNRFHVVDASEKMVSYTCSGTTLFRARSTAITAAASCPTVTAGSFTVSAIATNVNCGATSFNYTGPDLQRNAIVSMVLSIQDSSATATESVTLQHEVHLSNSP